MIKPLLLFFMLLPGLAHALSICSMTLNSSDEKEVFKKHYKGVAEFHELVPDSKDDQWLENACRSGIRCDVLLISGHFGGIFFGEKNSSILTLKKIEELGCQNTCGNILDAKEVYLMGCNTLATKTPDTRTIDQYLRVLVNDGFTQGMAEDVAASRYADFGLSISERMSVAFSSQAKLYGFGSKGPLGAQARPRLESALRSTSPRPQALMSSFGGTSFRVVTPQKELEKAGLKRDLVCDAKSPQPYKRKTALDKILNSQDNEQLNHYFDLILENTDVVSQILDSSSDKRSITDRLSVVAAQVQRKAKDLTEVQVKILKLNKVMGLLSPSDYLKSVDAKISARLAQGLDYIILSQICTIARKEPSLEFKANWISGSEASHPYFAKLASCFSKVSATATQTMKSWAISSTNSFVIKEVLRTYKSKWTDGEIAKLKDASNSWSSSLKAELRLSLKGAGQATSNCFMNAYSDDQKWNCFEREKDTYKTIESCLAHATSFQSQMGLGPAWDCLKKFPQDLSVSTCSIPAKYFATMNTEKGDDFLFYCWDQQRSARPVKVNRSECFSITDALAIPGNKIKQNWNCMNQISG